MLIKWDNIEKGLVCICYFVGIGSILFGALSDNDYRYYFVVFGSLMLMLVIIHALNMVIAVYKENLKNLEDISLLIINRRY